MITALPFNSSDPIFSNATIGFEFSNKAFSNELIEYSKNLDSNTLLIKTKRALKETGLKTLVISGGVSANKNLRRTMKEQLSKMGVSVYYPRVEFCTDNGAMIAIAGSLRAQKYGISSADSTPCTIKSQARWALH